MEETLLVDEQYEELGQSSLFMEMIPAEIQLNILEFVLGVNPELIEAKDIFEALDQAKLIVQENGNRFASVCKWFNNFKKEQFPKIARKNLKNYLTQHWAQEYLGKDIKELDEELANLWMNSPIYIECDKHAIEYIIKIAKIISAGAMPFKKFSNYYDASDKFMHFGFVSQHVLKPILLLFFPDFKIKYDRDSTALILAAQFRCSIDFVKFLLAKKDNDINKTNAKGYTALDYFQAYDNKTAKNQAIIKFLISFGAIENAQNVKAILIERENNLAGMYEHMTFGDPQPI